MNPKIARNSLSALSYILPSLAADFAIKIFATPRRVARPEWEQKIAATGQPAKVNDRIAILRWGLREAPIVLLVHGWAGRGTQLGFLVEPLLALGYQVVAMDAPAHGDSRGRRVNASIFAEAIVSVQKDIGPFAAVCAHSFGAAALVLAMSRGLKTGKAVCVAAPSEVLWIVHAFSKRMGLSPWAVRAFKRKIEAWAGVRLEEVSITKIGPSLANVPALIVHDPEDPDVPFENAEEYTEYWKGSRLLVLEGVGHRKILKSPKFIEAVTGFLGRA